MDCVCQYKLQCETAIASESHRSIYSLSESLSEITEIDASSNLVINRLRVPGPLTLQNPFLKLHHDMLVLVTGSSQLIFFDTESCECLAKVNCGGKRPYIPSSLCFSEDFLIFSTQANRNLYIFDLNFLFANGTIKKPTKIPLPQKVQVTRIQSQPHTDLIVAACTDGLIRVWNLHTREEKMPVVDTNNQELTKKLLNSILKAKNRAAIACVSFNEDGGRLLAGDLRLR